MAGAKAATKMLMKRGPAENGIRSPLAPRWAPNVVVDSTAYPSGMGKFVEQGGDGVPAGLGNKHANTRDVPRFGALLWR